MSRPRRLFMASGAPAEHWWDDNLQCAKSDLGGFGEAKKLSAAQRWYPQLLALPSVKYISRPKPFRFETELNPAVWKNQPTTFYFASKLLIFEEAYLTSPHAGKDLFSNPFHAIRAASTTACDGTLLLLAPASSVPTIVQNVSPGFPNVRFASDEPAPTVKMAIRCSDACCVWRLLKKVERSVSDADGELADDDAFLLLNDTLFRFENGLHADIVLATSQTHLSIKGAAVT